MKSQVLVMSKLRLPKSVKKYIRKEKARIRREIWDLGERERKIQELLDKFYQQKPAPTPRPDVRGRGSDPDADS